MHSKESKIKFIYFIPERRCHFAIGFLVSWHDAAALKCVIIRVFFSLFASIFPSSSNLPNSDLWMIWFSSGRTLKCPLKFRLIIVIILLHPADRLLTVKLIDWKCYCNITLNKLNYTSNRLEYSLSQLNFIN